MIIKAILIQIITIIITTIITIIIILIIIILIIIITTIIVVISIITLSTLSGHYIIAGDLNYMLNPSKDGSTHLDTTHIKSRAVLDQFLKELNL